MAVFGRQFDFMSLGKPFGIASVAFVVISIGSLLINSLELGLDFTAGTLVEVGYSEPVAVSDVSARLEASGFEDAQVVAFGSDQDVLIRLPVDDTVSQEQMAANLVTLGDDILASLRAGQSAELTINRLEFVGPRVGEELAESGGMGLLVALGIVMIYVAIRFQTKF